MSLVSNTFVLFVAATVILYYIVPSSLQWILLLAVSYLYYMSGNAGYVVYILYSTVVIYVCALLITYFREHGKAGWLPRFFVILGLILNLGMLGFVKYFGFFVTNLNVLAHLQLPKADLILPLGISFYTFQSSGYLLDVYWKKAQAQRNPFKFALFVSYFPQLLQGPIGKYDRLQEQLTAKHKLQWDSFCRGLERILWGYGKKIIIADWAGVFADAVWGNLQQYNGITFFALLFYGIQLYADFSGAIDIVIGISQLFGITLDENFRRPYLAVSMADFWKRWHITLGDWMMNYVFYPVSLSKWMMSFSKWSRKVFGKKTGRTMPIALADLIVFFLVGIWHGASWKYVVYGLLNGGIIAFSDLMKYQYRSWRQALHIGGNEPWFRAFQILRTFILVNLRWFFDRSDDLHQAGFMIRQAFTHFDPSQLLMISAGREGTAFVPCALLIIAAGSVIMVSVGILEERGVDVRGKVNALPYPLTLLICAGMFLLIGLFGCTGTPRGFIYAQF